MKRSYVGMMLVAAVGIVCSGCVLVAVNRPSATPAKPAAVAPTTTAPAEPVAAAEPPFDLPRMTEPLVLDGDLKEWKGATYVPIHNASEIDPRQSGHTWRGPADASIDAWIAWNDEGLCVAMIGYDDEVTYDAGKGLWQQDSLKLYLDLRAPDELGMLPRSPGLCAFYIAPPPDDAAAHELKTEAANGKIAGLKIIGKRVKGGYAAEMLIPWAAFSTFAPKAGAQLGVQFGLNDLDSADTNAQTTLQVSEHGGTAPLDNPETMIRWQLAETIKDRAAQEQHFLTK